MSLRGRTAASKGSAYEIQPTSLLVSLHKVSEHVTTPLGQFKSCNSSGISRHCSVFTCEPLHGLQPHADGLVGEQRGGGQRARHTLHYANVLHALGHRERGHSVVGFEGTVAVYAATCRMGGGKKTA